MLLFLFTMGFTSCSEDDKQEYYLELSQNSYEVIQGYSISIDLTAHENTTLNVENPELIDAAYIWELDGNKAKIEIKGKQKGETDLVVTDHETGESATIKVKVTEYPMPRLAIKQSKGNIFDTMNFYLYNEDSKSINSNSLSVVCDSIVWTVDEINNSFRVFEHEGVGNRLTLEWGALFQVSR